MRWKLLRRRLSISAPRMIVRSHVPWPLRCALAAIVLGFSAAIALWAFELGKDIAGLERDAKAELANMRVDVRQMREELDKAQSVANTADSLLRAERAAQEGLTQQLREAQAENASLKADLGFFERLLPVDGDGLAVRGLQFERQAPGQLRYQLLVMQQGKTAPEFNGSFDVTLKGTLEGRPWTLTAPEAIKLLKVRQYARVEGLIDHPEAAVVKEVQIKLLDIKGSVLTTQSAVL